MTQKYVEKCEEILSVKSEAKEALAKEVSNASVCAFIYTIQTPKQTRFEVTWGLRYLD